jgi:site-specific DNA-methyltransferase (adenine-specific)
MIELKYTPWQILEEDQEAVQSLKELICGNLEEGTQHLFRMDNRSAMSVLPEGFADMAVCDAPFGIMANTPGSGFLRGSNINADQKIWDNEKPGADFWREMFRISKDQIVEGANYFCPYLRESRGAVYWDKGNGKNFFSDGEMIYVSNATAIRRFDYVWQGYRVGGKKVGEKKIHPTQKPVALYIWLLQKYCKTGKRTPIIFDPFAGSGSVMIACMELGYTYIGCEKDVDYWQRAKERAEDRKRENEVPCLFSKKELRPAVQNRLPYEIF